MKNSWDTPKPAAGFHAGDDARERGVLGSPARAPVGGVVGERRGDGGAARENATPWHLCGIRPLVLGYPKNSSKFPTAVKSNSFPTILGPSVLAPRVLDDWRESFLNFVLEKLKVS